MRMGMKDAEAEISLTKCSINSLSNSLCHLTQFMIDKIFSKLFEFLIIKSVAIVNFIPSSLSLLSNLL